MIKSEIYEKTKMIVEKHDPLRMKKGESFVFTDEYEPEIDGIALFLADPSSKVNIVTIEKRVLFVFKNSFTKDTAQDGPYILKRTSKELFERVKP